MRKDRPLEAARNASTPLLSESASDSAPPPRNEKNASGRAQAGVKEHPVLPVSPSVGITDLPALEGIQA